MVVYVCDVCAHRYSAGCDSLCKESTLLESSRLETRHVLLLPLRCAGQLLLVMCVVLATSVLSASFAVFLVRWVWDGVGVCVHGAGGVCGYGQCACLCVYACGVWIA